MLVLLELLQVILILVLLLLLLRGTDTTSLLPHLSQATYLSFFPKRGRENLIIAVPSDGGNALTQANLVRALELFQRISDLSVLHEVRA